MDRYNFEATLQKKLEFSLIQSLANDCLTKNINIHLDDMKLKIMDKLGKKIILQLYGLEKRTITRVASHLTREELKTNFLDNLPRNLAEIKETILNALPLSENDDSIIINKDPVSKLMDFVNGTGQYAS